MGSSGLNTRHNHSYGQRDEEAAWPGGRACQVAAGLAFSHRSGQPGWPVSSDVARRQERELAARRWQRRSAAARRAVTIGQAMHWMRYRELVLSSRRLRASGLRLRVILRSPELPCESLAGSGPRRRNVVRDGTGGGVAGSRSDTRAGSPRQSIGPGRPAGVPVRGAFGPTCGWPGCGSMVHWRVSKVGRLMRPCRLSLMAALAWRWPT